VPRLGLVAGWATRTTTRGCNFEHLTHNETH
jgi:hypothetical protein